MDDAQLRTVWQQRQFSHRTSHISQSVTYLMKYTLAKRVRQLSKLGEVWDEVVPQELSEHTALESFNRGVLSVLVDSASHRFQLQTMLDGGLTGEIRSRFSGALNKIKLVMGQFYAIDLNGSQRYEF